MISANIEKVYYLSSRMDQKVLELFSRFHLEINLINYLMCSTSSTSICEIYLSSNELITADMSGGTKIAVLCNHFLNTRNYRIKFPPA